MSGQAESLVKYDHPVLVVTHGKGKGARKGRLPPVVAPGSAAAAGAAQTEDILDSILPPREWTEGGQLWTQSVSSAPATRLDVLHLQERLDRALRARQARETGLCPVREELYAQCFDDLIRQVTIACAERGLLLLRVRDEARTTAAAYQTLYESAVAFGMRKALQAEQGRAELTERVRSLEAENAELTRRVAEQAQRAEATERREADRREAEARRHAEDKDYFASRLGQLKAQLDAFTTASKK